MQQLQLDQLRIIPTGQAWHKTRVLSGANHRLAMARLAFDGLPGVLVDPRETLRSGPSYTIDTLRELQAENPGAELFLVIGQDQAAALPTWHAWQQVLGLAIICVAARPDVPVASHPLAPGPQAGSRFRQLDFPQQPVSASDIRQRIARGQGIAPLVGPAVARYIVEHHLYQPT